MPFIQSDDIRYYLFNHLGDAGIPHGTFTRRGGISPEPWASLNLGGTVGDDQNRVFENRRLVFNALGRSIESLYDVWQVHSANVVCAVSPRIISQPHLKADAILTDVPGVTLFMRFADCVPIFLYDPIRQVVGLVHAGWQGTIEKIAQIAIDTMRRYYSSNPQDILAGIGPSIGAHHYPVGVELARKVESVFGRDAKTLLSWETSGESGPEVKLDLWEANRLLLESSGVGKIEISNICTACHLDDWYSHRAERGRTGRFGALISL